MVGMAATELLMLVLLIFITKYNVLVLIKISQVFKSDHCHSPYTCSSQGTVAQGTSLTTGLALWSQCS